MKKITFLLAFVLLSFSSFGQEKVVYALGGVTFNFVGTNSMKATKKNPSRSYYNIENGLLSSHYLTYDTDGSPFGYYKQEVTISDLNFKSYQISDMYSDNPGAFEGWLLSIETKKMRDNVAADMRTSVSTSPTLEKRPAISILFNKKEDAQKFYARLKAQK